MSSAWLFQKAEDVRDHGEEAAPWYCGWYEPDGRRRKKAFGTGSRGKKLAQRFQRKTEAELMTGTYQLHTQKLWEDFRAEYRRRVLDGLAVRSRDEADLALANFERIVKPLRIFAVNTGRVDDFIAERRKEKGKRPGEVVSPATVNKDLRHIKAALGVAVEWGYLPKLPRFRMEKEPGKLARYISGDHFAALYAACDQARLPRELPGIPRGETSPAPDWWRALVVMGYMTGWRISELLALRRHDLDLETGEAITRAADNKGKRDERVPLNPVVVEHLRRLAHLDPRVFPWNHNRKTLQKEFARIQEAAGIHLPCLGQHKHSRFCHVYGFHDLRRAFATMNADQLTPDALQALMRHKSYTTTQRYINMTRQLNAAAANLHVPDVLKKAGG
jgi:integrase